MVTQTGRVTQPRRDMSEPQVIRGTTDIDDSVQTESTAFVLLTIKANAALRDVEVVLDLDKDTTGFGAVETAVTIQFQVGRLIDGSNYKLGNFQPLVALSGTLAATNRAQSVIVGDMAAGETVRIYAVTSADVTSDLEIPYECRFRGANNPTITEVAA